MKSLKLTEEEIHYLVNNPNESIKEKAIEKINSINASKRRSREQSKVINKRRRDKMRGLSQEEIMAICPPEKHGTMSAYVNYRCRCYTCKVAARNYSRSRRVRDQGTEVSV